MSDHLMNTYARLPVRFVRGEGAWLYDADGQRYLDSISGIGVCSLGHAHPAVTEALCSQAKQLVHTGNLAHVPFQEELAERLCAITGLERAFFCNSGAEANECALKAARSYAHSKGVGNPEVIVMEGSFHGRTLAMISASGSRKVQAGFEPLVPGFIRVPFGDVEAVEKVAAGKGNAVAVLVEPIQGEGGVVTPPAGYLQRLRGLCDDNAWLLMLDEIQTGLCKSGAWYACHHEKVIPDVLTTAKALGNGVPIGACLARGAAATALTPGKHGSTFGGSPLACRVGLAVLKTMRDESLARRATEAGERLSGMLHAGLKDLDCVRQIRARGLMLGIELDRPCQEIKLEALKRGLLLNVTREKVIRLLPPLIMSDDELEILAQILIAVIKEFNEG